MNGAIAARLKIVSVDWLFWAVMGLAIAGLGVSAYLWWGYTAPGATLACGGSGGCEAVKNSQYASLLGIPMPVLGLVTYGLVLLLQGGQSLAAVSRRGLSPYMALAVFGLSLSGVLYSAYLTYLELFVIYAICRWCIASAVIIVLIFFLSIINLRKINNPI